MEEGGSIVAVECDFGKETALPNETDFEDEVEAPLQEEQTRG